MRFVLAVLLLLSSSPAAGEPTIKDWRSADRSTRSMITIFLSGVEAGLATANGEFEDQKLSPMYCPPPKLALTADQVASILDEHLKSHPAAKPTYPLSIVLRFALADAFPCK